MDHYKKFISFSAEKTLNEYRTKKDRYWKTVGERMVLDLFKQTSKRVPAYKNYLRKNKINPANLL